MLKWNVDAYANHRLGSSGIRGVLKDYERKFLCIFSCSIGTKKSNKAEVLKI
jgi:hypothetical protein